MARPTKFKPEFVSAAKMLAEAGATDREIASGLGIAPSTFYAFCHLYPEFSDAIKTGKEPADNRVERSLYDRATGYAYTEQQPVKVKDGPQKEKVVIVDVERFVPPDTTSMIFWLKNRRPHEWRDKQEVIHGGTITHVVDEAAAQATLERVDRLIAAIAGGSAPEEGGTLQGQSLLPATVRA